MSLSKQHCVFLLTSSGMRLYGLVIRLQLTEV